MSEAIIMSLCGGILGIILGIVGAEIVYRIADIRTITSAGSIVVSFGVSVAIGLIFGISPAKRAAAQHPIEALRYEYEIPIFFVVDLFPGHCNSSRARG